MIAQNLTTALVVHLTAASDSGSDSGGSESGGSQAAEQAKGLTGSDWIQAGIILGATIVLSLLAAYALRKIVKRRNEMLASLAGRTAAAVVFVIGFVYALNSIGIAVGPLVGGLGIGGLAIAFALKPILKNLLAGIMIQLRQPFQVGDLVKLGDYFGKIEAVTLRTVDMQTVDGEYVLFPASTVLENPIENWNTLGVRREEVIVGIDYDADIDTVVEGLKEVVGALDVVIANDDRHVKIVINELAGSTVNLRVLAWHDINDHFLDVTHAISRACKQWCDENNVNLPFPTTTLRLNDVDALTEALSSADATTAKNS